MITFETEFLKLQSSTLKSYEKFLQTQIVIIIEFLNSWHTRRYIRSRGDEKNPKFHVDMIFWISCFPLGARIRHVDMKLDMTIGNPKWNSKKQYYFFIILAIVQDIYIDYRKFVCT